MRTARRGVNIREGVPNLYYSIMVIAVMQIALGVNFWLTTPVFHPLGIPKGAVAVVFFLTGLLKVWFLNVTRDLYVIRLLLAFGTSFMFFWGVVNAQQSFAGRASFQIPILYCALAILQLPLLRESFVARLVNAEEDRGRP